MSKLHRQLLSLSRRLHGLRLTMGLVAVVTTLVAALAVPPADGAISPGTVAGRAYAESLFSKVPLPSGVTRLGAPLKPLHEITGNPGFANLIDIVRYYRAASSIDIASFAQSHFPKSEWEGSGSTVDGGYQVSGSVSALSLCTNRHASFCGVTYSERALSQGEELRVDVAVVWTPIHVVLLPTSGVVTLTGYGRLSLANSSSEPSHVELSASEVTKLRSDIAVLRTSPGGLCMEDSTLYTITVASSANATPFWSATADECPGKLVIKYDSRQVSLNARSCPLESLISSFFPPRTATGTKLELKVCEAAA
ncbi:MAG: hypothetical protein WA860_05775 [Acidimicrobiales bacterium]